MGSESDEGEVDLFQEPADFYQPEKQATFASHQLLSGTELRIRLVGHNPLWVRFLFVTTDTALSSPGRRHSRAHLVLGCPCGYRPTSFYAPQWQLLRPFHYSNHTDLIGTLSLECRSNNLNVSRRTC
jgi:hypothetical protein